MINSLTKTAAFGLAASIVAFSASTASAANIYLSADAPGGANAVGNPALSFEAGDTGSLYVYITEDQKIADGGLALDVMSGTAGVIRFTDVEIFNPHMSAPPFFAADRWDGVSVLEHTDDMLRLNAGQATGAAAGIGADFKTLDNTYSNGAFAYAKIDFVAVGEGQTDLGLSEGANKIVNGGQQVTGLEFGTASITVTAIPEPASIAMLGLGAVALLRRK